MQKQTKGALNESELKRLSDIAAGPEEIRVCYEPLNPEDYQLDA